jgi:hypothetical protein
MITSFDSIKVSDGDHKITVNVTGAGGNTNEDTITVAVNQSGSVAQAQRPFGPGDNSIGAYAEKGLLGTHTTKSGKGEKKEKKKMGVNVSAPARAFRRAGLSSRLPGKGNHNAYDHRESPQLESQSKGLL